MIGAEVLKLYRKISGNSCRPYRTGLAVIFFLLFISQSFSQVTTEVDTTKIRIGEQISYNIKVEADSSSLIVFPEGQTFLPLEAVETTDIDTIKKDSRLLLSRIYKLTQFDSGAFTIPRQKIIIGDQPFFTDSLKVEVNTIEVDTTKQGLYDIKPIIEVDKTGGNWWKYLLLVILMIGLVGFLLYWFIWRKKPLSVEEEIALLPPYDRAKLAIKKLDESKFLISSEIKKYYSELTLIIRKYLDEKVYDRAMESTTDELIMRLQLLKDGNQFPFKKETIQNLESILKRADLVKFAKSKPDTALAEMDRAIIEKEIENVKACLPEPSEEEKLLDKQYKEALEQKKKRKKILLTVLISIFLIVATIIGFGIKYGFGYVKDTIVGHESKELLEGDWVKSAYGFPPVWIETPRVLKRVDAPLPEEAKEQMSMTTFIYGTMLDIFSVAINTTTLNVPKTTPQTKETENPTFDLIKVSEESIKGFETKGARDILVKRDQFITPNGAEGLKTFGTFNIVIPNTNRVVNAEYALFCFSNENVLQQIIITWPDNDEYADEMVQRIIDSIELNPNNPEEEN
ncbi:BatD family protein [Winogradskyella alexanderae]|uniref:BatD family protein n=1 Tax=Winogradskyella alexanderae TaxID=2877123 RepID=A0ABS7XNZ9_9FLAO|nr:BatD family protein [Winogradskyella alexanderae]MCA0131109.1 BatD family protein [Winogradskyella alexanderae]